MNSIRRRRSWLATGIAAATLASALVLGSAAGAEASDSASAAATARRPGNDDFARARPHSGPGWVHYGTNVGATKQPCEANHAGNYGGHSVWWKWRAGRNGYIDVNLSRSNFDTLLGVYRGQFGLCNLQFVASDDDGGQGLRSRLTFYAQRGVTYYFAVDGYNGLTGNIGISLRR